MVTNIFLGSSEFVLPPWCCQRTLSHLWKTLIFYGAKVDMPVSRENGGKLAIYKNGL
jgi:hypothetical protein